MSENTIVLLVMVAAGVALSIWGGLDVDNAWGSIVAFIGGIGTKTFMDGREED